jgi:hypothetical protein
MEHQEARDTPAPDPRPVDPAVDHRAGNGADARAGAGGGQPHGGGGDREAQLRGYGLPAPEGRAGVADPEAGPPIPGRGDNPFPPRYQPGDSEPVRQAPSTWDHAKLFWQVLTAPAPGTPKMLDFSRIFEVGPARQGFLDGMSPVGGGGPPADPADRREWQRGSDIALAFHLAAMLAGGDAGRSGPQPATVPGGRGGPAVPIGGEALRPPAHLEAGGKTADAGPAKRVEIAPGVQYEGLRGLTQDATWAREQAYTTGQSFEHRFRVNDWEIMVDAVVKGFLVEHKLASKIAQAFGELSAGGDPATGRAIVDQARRYLQLDAALGGKSNGVQYLITEADPAGPLTAKLREVFTRLFPTEMANGRLRVDRVDPAPPGWRPPYLK